MATYEYIEPAEWWTEYGIILLASINHIIYFLFFCGHFPQAQILNFDVCFFDDESCGV